MSIYAKLNAARNEFHSLKLKKSGLNKFAGYEYFELGDFVIPAIKTLSDHDICAYISFGKELATMKIVDVTDSAFIEITSPMSSAALKGAHEIQNLGAVQSYLRRYLWMTALEIVEHDAVDSSKPVEPKLVHTPTGTPDVSQKRMSVIVDVAEAVKERFSANDILGAWEEYSGITDGDEKIALWKLLPSNVRSAIKKQGESIALDALTTN